jgi:hypothetical protein
MSEKPLRKCPECKKLKLKRVPTLPVVKVIGGPTSNITLGTQSEINEKKLSGKKKENFKEADKKHRKRRLLSKLSKLDERGQKKYIERGVL